MKHIANRSVTAIAAGGFGTIPSLIFSLASPATRVGTIGAIVMAALVAFIQASYARGGGGPL